MFVIIVLAITTPSPDKVLLIKAEQSLVERQIELEKLKAAIRPALKEEK